LIVPPFVPVTAIKAETLAIVGFLELKHPAGFSLTLTKPLTVQLLGLPAV
jgi:hypothetical protein